MSLRAVSSIKSFADVERLQRNIIDAFQLLTGPRWRVVYTDSSVVAMAGDAIYVSGGTVQLPRLASGAEVFIANHSGGSVTIRDQWRDAAITLADGAGRLFVSTGTRWLGG